MKITGAWEVSSHSRPGFKHRVTRYEADDGVAWSCSCEAGYYRAPCAHTQHVQLTLKDKGLLP